MLQIFRDYCHVSLKHCLFLLSAVLLLTACGSTPNQSVKIASPSTNAADNEPAITSIDSEELLHQAYNLPVPTTVNTLVLAAEQAYKEQDYARALFIGNQISHLPTNTVQKANNLLLIAKALLALNYVDKSLTTLDKIDYYIIPNSDYWLTRSQVYQAKNDKVASLISYLNYADVPTVDSIKQQEIAFTTWQKISTLTYWQLKQFARNPQPSAKAWLDLHALLSNVRFDSNTNLNQQLALWQQRNPTHLANTIVEQVTTLALIQQPQFNNIAVLLPLSGREETLGHIIQQGIFAAYRDNPNQQLHFFDTNAQSIQEIAQQLVTLNVDFIIGPLLKKHVDNLIAYRKLAETIPSLVTDNAIQLTANINHIPVLLLNLPDELPLAENTYALSMRPEDEAMQAAETLSRRGYLKPIVLSQRNDVGIRVADAFTKQWQDMTAHQPVVVLYDDADKMQTVVEDILDVTASKNRISDLDVRINGKIYSEKRNRRDIDMIYIFGNTEHTRLLKPFIDVNISPFAKTIPIYASSRSHSSSDDLNISRDLVGLTFTDMPWLIDNPLQNKTLKVQTEVLWPNRKDTLQRLFAMGVDSIALVNKVTLMKENPYLFHQGQTGVLSLNDQGVLERSLIWAKYLKHKVMTIAMD